MLVEALARLSTFGPVKNYQYVGFGSPFFVDFRLFHRRLAITDMVSIEVEAHLQARFDLNTPFDCVRMEYGHSSECLPQLDWTKPSIVWLDYDSPLTQTELADIDRVVEVAKHGDCLLVTVDADPPDTDEDVEQVRERLGRSAGQLGSPESLSGWELSALYYDVIADALALAVRERGDSVGWRQLFHFQYKDSTRMLTVGGVFVEEARQYEFDNARFKELSYVSFRDEDPFLIQMPQLTLVETGKIDKHMPDRTPDAVRALAEYGVDRDQVERYARVYRHAPTFHESQV